MKKPAAPKMEYVGDRTKPDELQCNFHFNGKDYLIDYNDVKLVARLYRMPYQVRENIFNWAKMLNNPD